MAKPLDTGSYDDPATIEENHSTVQREKPKNSLNEIASSPFKDTQPPAFIASLAVANSLASLEHSVVVTSAPTIVADLDMGEEYIWITNAFFVCSAAFQPFLGQLSNIFGRRWLMLFVTTAFTMGSGICGGARDGRMLIAGRAIQGFGSGGILMLVEIVLADLVPLRQRGYYLAIILGLYTIGLTLGPIIRGIIVGTTTWRWVFYINLPIGATALLVLYVFLHVNYDREMSLSRKLRRVDWAGKFILMVGTLSILYASTYAGTTYAWDSWHTLLEVYGLTPEPVIPTRLFRHRTSIAVALNTLFHSMLVYWGLYFLPLYFEAVLLFSPERTGISLLPITLIAIPGAAISAMAVSRWGRFKLMHVVGFATFTLGLGLMALQGKETTTAQWATFQSLSAFGAGIVLDTLLPAFQAPVAESDQAAATATWSFIRTFGSVWGVALPAVIFNNRVAHLASTIADPHQAFINGGAYQHGTPDYISSLGEPLRSEIHAIYRDALKLVFLASMAFGGAGILLSLVEKDVPLRKDLKTEFSFEEQRK